jgi:hypothetical protein
MTIKIHSITKRSKALFVVAFSVDGQSYQTQARVSPKRGHGVEFMDPAANVALFHAGRVTRQLCDLLVRMSKGYRPRFPKTLVEGESKIKGTPSLTLAEPVLSGGRLRAG